MGTADLDQMRRCLEAGLSEAMAKEQVKREPIWTESQAVGSAGFIEKIQPLILSRRETEVIAGGDGMSVLRECPAAYGAE